MKKEQSYHMNASTYVPWTQTSDPLVWLWPPQSDGGIQNWQVNLMQYILYFQEVSHCRVKNAAWETTVAEQNLQYVWVTALVISLLSWPK